MAGIIGKVTKYQGTEHPYMRGLEVRIVAVLKGCTAGNRDPDEAYQTLRDEDSIIRSGGITEQDRLEVQPWVGSESRFSFVTSDARAEDLAGLRLATLQ